MIISPHIDIKQEEIIFITKKEKKPRKERIAKKTRLQTCLFLRKKLMTFKLI